MRWVSANFWVLIFTFTLLPSLFFLPVARASESGEIETITVMAESGLSIPMAQISSLFTKGRMISVSNNFGASELQKKKIEDGESADIFITSQNDLLQQLKNKGLIDIYSISKIAQQNDKAYVIAVVAGENMNPARVFLEYLKSDEAKALFKKNGFTTP